MHIFRTPLKVRAYFTFWCEALTSFVFFVSMGLFNFGPSLLNPYLFFCLFIYYFCLREWFHFNLILIFTYCGFISYWNYIWFTNEIIWYFRLGGEFSISDSSFSVLSFIKIQFIEFVVICLMVDYVLHHKLTSFSMSVRITKTTTAIYYLWYYHFDYK